MTNIKFRISANTFLFDAQGHADYAPAGQDIVCSAISTLSFLLLNACDEAEKKNEINALNILQNVGNIHINFCFTSHEKSIRDIVKLVATEFGELSRQYPENVNIQM